MIVELNFKLSKDVCLIFFSIWSEYNQKVRKITRELENKITNVSFSFRRVYDALNVLMAMNIIAKEKKEIRWLGLPANAANECAVLEERKKKLVERIRTKTQQLQDLIIQVDFYSSFLVFIYLFFILSLFP